MTSAKVLNKICPEFVYIRLHKTNPVPAGGGGGEGVGEEGEGIGGGERVGGGGGGYNTPHGFT